jgi:polysaccharide transporter, PST family
VIRNLRDTAARLARHSTVQNALWLYGVQIAGYIFPLITVPYLSRVLSPEKFGLVMYGQSVIWYFITLSEYGFNLTATRSIAVHKSEPAAVSRIFNAVLWTKMVLMALGFALMAGAVYAIPRLRAEWALFYISFLTVVGGVLFPLWLYQGLEKLRHVAIRDFAGKLIATILIFIVVKEQDDYLFAAAVQSGAGVVTGALSLVLVPALFGIRFRLPERAAVIESLREGWPVFLSLAAMTLVFSTNIFVLGLVATPAQLGHYMAAFRLIVAVRAMVAPAVTALYPFISRKAAEPGGNVVGFLRKYWWVLAAPFLLSSIVMFAAAEWIVRILFGPEYENTVLLLRILSLSPFLLALSHTFTTNFMLAFGYDRQWMRLIIQSTVFNFVILGPALWFLRPDIGMALVGISLDLFAVVVSYLFFRKKAPEHERADAPVSGK